MPTPAPDPIRQAIYERLFADAALRDLLGAADAIYHQIAPAKAKQPYVVIDKQTGNPVEASFGTGRRTSVQRDRWMVKAVCSGGSASPAEAAAMRIDELLYDAPLTIANNTLLLCRRISDVNYPETNGPDRYSHVGGIYRIDTQPT